MWNCLVFDQIEGSLESFYKSTSVWLQRPNVCNKLISCCTLKKINLSNNDVRMENSEIDISYVQKFISELLHQLKLIKCSNCNFLLNSATNGKDVSCFLRKLIPHKHDRYHISYEIVIVTKHFFLFFPLNSSTYQPSSNGIAYMITFCHNLVGSNELSQNPLCSKEDCCSSCNTLSVFNCNCQDFYSNSLVVFDVENNGRSALLPKQQSDCFPSKDWIVQTFFPKLCKWCREPIQKDNTSQQLPASLSLLDQENYSLLYHNIKIKYGLPISKIWPEVTDPQKFVFEDVAIATYLLLLWEKERKLLGTTVKQSFADLGCGNGLLVHILVSEGHDGIGYDIRRRQIWDMYDKTTKLIEATVSPESLCLVENYDWILGNHSDELTPWIPVMSARCGYNRRYWVLPCCFFDFYGKYERSNPSRSQYHDYLDYIKTIGEKCGFLVETDVMRIPSTKRVCYVGMSRNYLESKHQENLNDIERLVESKRLSTTNVSKEFVARPAEIKIRNCTKLNRELQDEAVKLITSHLLTFSNITRTSAGKKWNRGGKLSLSDAIQLLPGSTRSALKKECGGLQTLLRNFHQIFEISSGEVQLRNWSSLEVRSGRKRKKNSIICIKTKRCWFYDFHPDGCPRSSDECTFLHSEDAAHT